MILFLIPILVFFIDIEHFLFYLDFKLLLIFILKH